MKQIIDLVKHNARLVALIAVVVILVVVTFIFYSGSQSSADQQAKLEKQETTAENNLIAAQNQYDVATLQVEEANLVGSPHFPTSFPSVDLTAYLAAAADKYGVQLTKLTPSGAVGKETIGGKQYTRYDTVVEVAGDSESMNSFLRYLEAGPFLSLRIENATFTPSGGKFTVIILTQS